MPLNNFIIFTVVSYELPKRNVGSFYYKELRKGVAAHCKAQMSQGNGVTASSRLPDDSEFPSSHFELYFSAHSGELLRKVDAGTSPDGVWEQFS